MIIDHDDGIIMMTGGDYGIMDWYWLMLADGDHEW